MPRTRLGQKYSEPQRPPIDWLRAAYLERSAALGYSLKRLSVIGGISYDSMKQWNRKSPWDWPPALRDKICRELGITPVRGVQGMPGGDSYGAS